LPTYCLSRTQRSCSECRPANVVVSILEAFFAEILQTAEVQRASAPNNPRFREAAGFLLNFERNGAYVHTSYN
jgi:hypothetical protein